MKQVFILIVIIFSSLLSCNDPVKTVIKKENVGKSNLAGNDSAIIKTDSVHIPDKEDSIFDEITKISEIAAFNNLLKKNSRKLVMWIVDTIQKNNKPYILYNVGEDNGFSLVGKYHFAREINNNKILSYDVVEGEILTLEAWRRKENKKSP